MNKIALLTVLLASAPVLAQDPRPGGTLPLEDCRIRAGEGFPGIKARCGMLTRPLNPSDADAGTIELFVAVVPALTLEPEPDAFVPIAGGPGQASTAFYAAYAGAFEEVRRSRDIVVVDQRGTGESAPLSCDADEEMVEGRYSRARAIEEAERCLAALPYDPRFFTTSVAVEDLEAVRAALGYTQFNLYGISYGSRVAQHFLRRYPQSARTVILDGVVAPQIALGPGIAVEAQNALDVMFERCANSQACSARFPDLRANFEVLRESLGNDPVRVALPDPLTGAPEEIVFGREEMAGALRLLSYHPSSVALMPLLLDEAVNGNFLPLAAQFLMTAASISETLSIGMHNAVVCTEDAPYFDGEGVTSSELEATYIGPLQIDALDAICSVWPTGALDTGFKLPVESDVPVLLLSGEADPITPPAYAELAAVDLRNALHLVGKNQGHGQAALGCMPDIIGDFVAAGSTEAVDAECIDRLFAMPFFVDFSGPSP